MSTSRNLLIGLSLVGASLLAVAGAQTSENTMKRGDRKFIEKAAEHSIAEIQAGKIAEAKGASAAVKNFGQMMAQDHGKAYAEIVGLARAKSMALPGQPDKADRKDAERLLALTGAEFDLAYMSEMVAEHEKDVKEFDRMARRAKDPDVKAFAAKTLPVLQGHLQMARDVYASTRTSR